MDKQLIMLICGCFFLFMALLRWIDWYKVFKHFYGNNPLKAKIYLKIGETEEVIEGKYSYVDDKYIFYSYDFGKRGHTVAVSLNYPYIYVFGKRKILVDFGKGVAKPLSGIVKTTIGSETLNDSVNGALATKVVNSIQSRGFKVQFQHILLIIAVLIGAFLFYRHYQEQESSKVPAGPGYSQEQIEEMMGGEK